MQVLHKAKDHAPPRLGVKVGAVVVLIVLAIVSAIVVSALSNKGTSGTFAAVPPSAAATNSVSTGSRAVIFVHVVGAVVAPGLYELRDGDRVVDAVSAAGGLTDTADQEQLNLARFVSDGEQLIVPTIGETPLAASGTVGGKVNINTADQATLETLPRVGPAMAERIVAWRTENGRFSAIEDLMSVTGIGQKTFDGFKSLITI